jgi:hypothetical protein
MLWDSIVFGFGVGCLPGSSKTSCAAAVGAASILKRSEFRQGLDSLGRGATA